MSARRACFYAAVADPALLNIVEFYRDDIRILRDLGYEVTVVNVPWRMPPRTDLVFTWWWATGLPTLARSLPAGVPNVFTGAHHFFQPGWDWQPAGLAPKLRVKQLLIRIAFRLASANLFISDEELRIVEHLRERRPFVVRPAVDAAYFSPDPGVERDMLVTISHLTRSNVKRKMIVELVDGFAELLRRRPDERLIIVGERLDGARLVEEAVERHGIGDRVRFAGRVSRDEKRRLLQQAKAYLQPTRYEGFGLAVAEAMACGAPVVVSPKGAITEVVGDDGRYFAGDSPADLADGILGVLRDTDGAAELGRRGRARIASMFSYERRRDGIAGVLRAL